MFDRSVVSLAGRKGLITGIANDQSIAWGCAQAFRFLGADLAVTYLGEKAKPHVAPLARQLESEILLPLDLREEGQLEVVFAEIEKRWGRLDFLLHSIAFAPRDDLHGRVVDCSKAGFLQAMDISCWSFIRMAKLAEPLMDRGGALFCMTYHGSHIVIDHYNMMGPVKAALESATRYMAAESVPKAFASMQSRRGRSRPAPPQASPSSTSCWTRPRPRHRCSAWSRSRTSASRRPTSRLMPPSS